MAKQSAEEAVIDIEQEPAPLVKRRLAKPAPLPLAVSRCPEINDWPMALRELPRQNGLMLEDFGLSKSSLAHHAMKARKGGKESAAKLEAVKQALLDLMGFDTEMREVRTEEGDKVPVMVPSDKPGIMIQAIETGRPVFETEERSRWGVRAEGPDLIVTAAKSIRPVAANWKRIVEMHFLSLVVILDWVQTKPALLIGKGRKHPDPELAKESHGALLHKDKGEYTHPTRKAGAAFAAEYMGGKQAEWNGLD